MSDAPLDLTLPPDANLSHPCNLGATFDPTLGYTPYCPSGQSCYLDRTGVFCQTTNLYPGCILTNRLADALDLDNSTAIPHGTFVAVVPGQSSFLSSGESCSLCPVPLDTGIRSSIHAISNVDTTVLALYSNCNGGQFFSRPIASNSSLKNQDPFYCEPADRVCVPVKTPGSSCLFNLECDYPGLSHCDQTGVCGSLSSASNGTNTNSTNPGNGDGQNLLPPLTPRTKPQGLSSTALSIIIVSTAFGFIVMVLGMYCLFRKMGRRSEERRKGDIRSRRIRSWSRGFDSASGYGMPGARKSPPRPASPPLLSRTSHDQHSSSSNANANGNNSTGPKVTFALPSGDLDQP
ncbi:uncharacterized protein BJ171DRAFT_229473 [Polychytrium aggregatum]|uniref:uncharacterized protein n=1 Tax=Polychytrium aggregatum TaxID=110093 RepID=UPI0022FE7C0F|nr:uncharacterized protein BJ171DRAFT_229473 [Polychytrium aggregatum]KAI9197196.1 hypothetical protein BJ171DRAFT_229473 [Polychytrium aggregatum]